ncbi:MAG: tandem-95 repeat protein, partial [Rhodospirillales bacterium]
MSDAVPAVIPALMPAIQTDPATGIDPAVIRPEYLPSDGQFNYQWQWNDTSGVDADVNISSVWDDYTGAGVVVGIMDTGIDYNHPDLAPNYRHDLDYDTYNNDGDAYASTSEDDHGTAVAGMIAGAFGGGDIVGAAPGADIAGIRVSFDYGTTSDFREGFAQWVNFDIVNNSWGFTYPFADNAQSSSFAVELGHITNATRNGRDGLGTIATFAAGNSRTSGDNVNYHNLQNSRHTISVAATTSEGAIAYFSTPGAANLVAAPGYNVVTSDVTGSSGYSSGSYTSINGTSFAAPTVAGIAALMLEANPELGYRDVQEILAYSARNPLPSTTGWQTNGAVNWNGGGLTVSHDYGFGLVDAHNAVRLAETWNQQSTAWNEWVRSGYSSPHAAITDYSTVTDTMIIPFGVEIDYVEVDLNIEHTYIGDLVVRLTSPDGTTSTLIDRPWNGSLSWDDLDFTVSSTQFWGETGVGAWTLSVYDGAGTDFGELIDWTLRLYGDALTNDDVYIFTDEFERHGGEAGRGTISDTDGGTDTLNFAPLTTSLSLDLSAGSSNTLFGHSLNFAPGTQIENVYGGDAGDVITGNDAANMISGMRGDDTLFGGAGDDTLVGGSGNDFLSGGVGIDTAVFEGLYTEYTISRDEGHIIVGGDYIDTLLGIEILSFADQSVYISASLVDDHVNAVEDEALIIAADDLLANDIDHWGEGLTITAADDGAHGMVEIDGDGNITYIASADFSGIDTFTYTAEDGTGLASTATVNVYVAAVADAPTVSVSVGEFSPIAVGDALTESGGEFQVNTTTLGSQYDANIAALADGGFVITWWSYDNLTADSIDVYAQRYDASGSPAGSEFLVNSFTTDSQASASVAGLADGGFVVTWNSNGQDGSGQGIFGQSYDASGTAVGGEFQINSYIPADQDNASVTALNDGGFVVVWQSFGQDANAGGIFAQRYDADGVAAGGEFKVNLYEQYNQGLPSVAALADGGFAVSWQSVLQDGSANAVVVRKYDAAGNPVGIEAVANTYTPYDQSRTSIAALADGGYVVTWQSSQQDGSYNGVFGQRFDTNGYPVGDEFQVNQYTNLSQSESYVTGLADGGFFVTWNSGAQDGSSNGVYGRRYDEAGVPAGNEFLVNTTAFDEQYNPAAVQIAGGQLVTAWRSSASGSLEIMGQLYDVGTLDYDMTADLHIAAVVSDMDGSESITSVTVDGLPVGALLSAGTDNGNGSWTLTSDELTGLTITIPASGAGAIDLAITATATESANGDTSIASQTVTITPYDAPVAADVSATIDEDGSLSGQLSGSDPNGDELTFAVADGPVHGSVTVNADGTYDYAPDENYSGIDNFTFTVTDPDGNTGTGTVTVGVMPVADAPDLGVGIGAFAMADPDGLFQGTISQVNTTTQYNQYRPAMAALSDGGWLTVWSSNAVDENEPDIYGQRFDASGAPFGEEFQINSYTNSNQTDASAIELNDGSVLVTWISHNQDGSGFGVYGQRYGADGAVLGSEFRLNNATSGRQMNVEATPLSDGGFVVAFESEGNPGGILVRRFNADGTPAGNEFVIADPETDPAIVSLQDGGFFVSWLGDTQHASKMALHGQRFDAAGNAVGDPLFISRPSPHAPEMTTLADGRVAMVWIEDRTGDTLHAVKAQFFDASGVPVGSIIDVSESTNGGAVDVAALPGGGFAVTWEHSAVEGGQQIYARQFTTSGEPFTDEIRVDSGITNTSQINPELTVLSDGRVVVSWTSQDDVHPNDDYNVSSAIISGPSVKISAPLEIDIGLADTDGSEFVSITIAGMPADARLSAGVDNGDGTWTLTPDQLSSLFITVPVDGNDNFSLTVTATATESANGDAATTVETIAVAPYDTPDAHDAVAAVNEDGTISGQLTANDPNGDPLTFARSAEPLHGTAIVNADGTYTYTPDADFSGSDTFTFSVTDPDGNVDTAKVIFNVGAVADAPTVSVEVGEWSSGITDEVISIGDAFQLNTYTSGTQWQPTAVALAEGGWVSTWTSEGQDGSSFGVYGQRFDAGGNTVGSEFQVNTYTSGIQSLSRAVALADGGFNIFWNSYGQDGDLFGVFGQKYDAAGATVGGEFQVNEYTDNYQLITGSANLADGGSVVVWQSNGIDGDLYEVYAKRFDANGDPVGSDFRVNSTIASQQANPDVAGLSTGGFVAVWESSFQDGSQTGAYLQRFDASGNQVGGEIQANTHTDRDQRNVAVSETSDGAFVVVWESNEQDGDGFGIYGQRFEADGTPAGAEFQISTSTSGNQSSPDVIPAGDGGFMVAWLSSHDGLTTVYAQLYDSNGTEVGVETALTSETYQDASVSLESLPSGEVVASWTAYNQDGSGRGSFASVIGFPESNTITAPLTITSALSDADGSETLSVTVAGVPAGATLSAGADNGDGSWTLSANELAGLTISVPGEGEGAIDLTVTATATELSNGNAAAVSQTLTLIPYPQPVAEDASVDVNEDTGFNGQLVAADPNGDAVTFSVQTGPAHGSVNINSDGSYTYTPDADYSGADSFMFNATDPDGNVGTGTITVDVAPVADAPSLDVSAGEVALINGDSLVGTGEFLVNATVEEGQAYPSSAALADGGFVITWRGDDDSVSRLGIYAQRFDAYGAPSGAEFQVNTDQVGYKQYPQATPLADGGFLITWAADAQDGDGYGVYAQRYDASGATVGGEFLINTTTVDDQDFPAVTTLSDGGLVVTWESTGQDGSVQGIFGQRYDSSANAIGAEFQVNTYTESQQTYPAVAALGDSGFVVTWQSYDQDGSNQGVFGQRFDAAGSPAGTEFQVNTEFAYQQMRPSVASLDDGGFIVSWHSYAQDGDHRGIFAQRYDAAGSVVGGEFQVNTHATGSQELSAITSLDDGGFLITWQSQNLQAPYFGIYGQRYDAAGAAVGGEFLISGTSNHSRNSVDATTLSDGRVLVSWNSWHQDGSREGIYANILDPNGQLRVMDLDITSALSDVDGSESLSITVAGIPDGATLSAGIINGDGSWTLTPAELAGLAVIFPENGEGTVDLTVTATSTEGIGGDTAAASQTITLAPYPQPVAEDASESVEEDGSVSGQLAAVDPNGDAVTYSTASGPAHGSVTVNADGSYTYTPDADYSGSDSFTFNATDPDGHVGTGTITIDVAPVADAPDLSVSVDQYALEVVSLPAGEFIAVALDVSGTLTDADGSENISYTIAGLPEGAILTAGSDNGNGTWTVNTAQTAGLQVLLPEAGSGTTDLTVSAVAVEGANGDTEITSQVITLKPYDAPRTGETTVSLDEDTGISGQLSAADPNGDALTFQAEGAPANGNVVINADGTYTYTPDADFNGTDSFTYTVSDPDGNTGTATVTVDVVAVNDAPVAAGTAFSVQEDSSIAGTLSAVDVDGDNLNFSLTTQPSNGTVTLNADGSYVYVPDADFHGDDSFSYTVSDGNGGTDAETVSITVTPVNDAPVVADRSITTDEDVAVSGQLTATDVDGDTVTFALDSGPANGSVTVNPDGSYTYTPDDNYAGNDSFTVTADDGNGGTETVTVSVSIGAVADTAALDLSLGETSILQVSGPAGAALTPDNARISAPLTISVASPDEDGSETLSVRVAGLPNGTRLSAGTQNASGDWILTPVELAGLMILSDNYAGGNVQLNVTVTSTDGASQAVVMQSYDVAVPASAASAMDSAVQISSAPNTVWSLSTEGGGEGVDLVYEIVDGSGGGVSVASVGSWVTTSGGRVRITDASTGAYEYEASPG